MASVTYIFKRECEPLKLGRVVQLGAVQEPPCPGVDGRHGVGGGGLALLVHAVVARHSAVRRLRLHRAPVGAHQHRRHHAQGTVTLDIETLLLKRPRQLETF